jgi:FkbM family methyltransferase
LSAIEEHRRVPRASAGYDFSEPLLIYGAGGSGRSVARHLRTRGVAVAAFLDAGASADLVDGIPVFTLPRWASLNDTGSHDILVSIHNHYVPVAPIVKQLRAAGFRRVLTMVDYVNATDDNAFRYWLGRASTYADAEPRIEAAARLFADPASRAWFEALLNLGRSGEYEQLPPPSLDDEYVPSSLPRWREPMRLIDCGAFDGDSIETLRRAGYHLDAVAAFEPDQLNFAKLARKFHEVSGCFVPCGVSDNAELVTFAAGEGAASRVETGGKAYIQCVAIDQAVPTFAPTLIKMDIEGFEPKALRGAAATLCQYRPGLAISVYHEPDHLWEVPLYLESLGLDYDMFLRGHWYNGYGTVLYCLPKSGLMVGGPC